MTESNEASGNGIGVDLVIAEVPLWVRPIDSKDQSRGMVFKPGNQIRVAGEPPEMNVLAVFPNRLRDFCYQL
jgi:hypothetical protein